MTRQLPATRPLVVFDLDGVLIDSAPGIRHSIDHALASVGLAAATDDEARAMLGPPLHSGFGRLVAERAEHAALVEQLVGAFRADYASASLRLTSLHDGSVELIHQLRNAGYRTALATSKARPATEPLLAQFGLDVLLDPIGCPRDVVNDSKSDVLRWVLQQADADGSGAVMVGDRSHDMLAAREVGAWALGAGWGYGSEDELLQSGAHAVAHTVDEVLELVASAQ